MELGRRRGAEPVSPAVHCLGAEIAGSVADIDVYAVVPCVDLEDAGHHVSQNLGGGMAGLRRSGGINARGRQGYFSAITGFQISQGGRGIFEGEVGAGRYPPIGVGPGGVLPEVEFSGEGGPRGRLRNGRGGGW